MAMGQKRVPKNPIGKRNNRLKPVVPKGFLFDPNPYTKCRQAIRVPHVSDLQICCAYLLLLREQQIVKLQVESSQ